jgi:CcmD family protein
MKKISLSTIIIFSFLGAMAQDSGVEMANALRSSGKIYVVVAVISVIFAGLFGYLFSIDKRVKKIEQENKQ